MNTSSHNMCVCVCFECDITREMSIEKWLERIKAIDIEHLIGNDKDPNV